MLIPGILSFALFFVSDLNDLKWNKRWLKPAFFAGAVTLLVSVVMSWVQHFRFPGWILTIVFVVIGGTSAVLLVISLFFSFSPSDGYLSQGMKRKVFDKRLYALCRHPGVLFFALVFFSLSVFGYPLINTIVLSGLNILLALFEDRIVFPELLSGYQQYRKQTPFLIPNIQSMKACINDFREERHEVSGKA